MSIEVYECHQGAQETVNADHIAEWDVEGGRAYLVCDGIDHTPLTATVVQNFGRNLVAADWNRSDDSEQQLIRNVIQAVPHLPTDTKAVVFCLSVAVVRRDTVLISHCGGCRVRQFSGNGVEWLTKDDVPALRMYNQGILTREQYHQYRNLPSCKLKTGARNTDQIKTRIVPKPSSGHLLLCSDGFWVEMEDQLTGAQALCLQAVKQTLPELRNTASDNFSVIIA